MRDKNRSPHQPGFAVFSPHKVQFTHDAAWREHICWQICSTPNRRYFIISNRFRVVCSSCFFLLAFFNHCYHIEPADTATQFHAIHDWKGAKFCLTFRIHSNRSIFNSVSTKRKASTPTLRSSRIPAQNLWSTSQELFRACRAPKSIRAFWWRRNMSNLLQKLCRKILKNLNLNFQ